MSLLDMIEDETSILRLSIPCFLLVVYAFAGAGLFYALETVVVTDKCSWDYWTSLWFVNTVFTTIGYGNVAPCTVGGKVFTVIYTLLGVPLTLLTFGNVGEIICRPISHIYRMCCGNDKKKKTEDNTMQLDDFPLVLALIIVVAWFLASAAWFFFMSKDTNTTKTWYPANNWAFAESMYFVAISITTIGFGDFYPRNFDYTVPHFAFIIVGMSLFSMLINLIQSKILKFTEKVKDQIIDTYLKSLQNSDHPGQLKLSDEMGKIKGGKLMYHLLDSQVKKDLQQELNDLMNRNCVNIQTDDNMINEFVQTVRGKIGDTCVNNITQTSKTFATG